MAHEDFSREQWVEGSSERAFGLVFAGLFLLLAAWPLLHAAAPRWWALGAAFVCALLALAKPRLLAGANRLWTAFGLLLGRLVGPIALALLYYAVLTPVRAALWLGRKDPLRLRRDPAARSYWLERRPPGPPPDSMTNQF